MRAAFAPLAFAALAAANPVPQAVTSAIAPSASAPAGCSSSYNGKFEIQIVNVTSTKRSVQKRQDDVLTLTLSDGTLTDAKGRTGYIAANQQFQFDGPPQAGAIYTTGWSACSNGTLALGGSTVFYQCLSGTFYNLYDASTGNQCSEIYIEILNGAGAPATAQSDGQPTASAVASEMSDGQPTASPAPVCQTSDGQIQITNCAPVTQISDGQIQATTGSPVTQISDGQIQATTASPVTQISDGQIQATTASPVSQISDGQIQATTGAPVTQISDGQIQATTASPVSQISDGQIQATTGAPVTQISDGQIQATTASPVTQISDGQIQATTGAPVTQISDGQIQATTGAPVTQISDGQIQATTGAVVSQISDGQIQATTNGSVSTPTASVQPYTGGAATMQTGVFGVIVAALAMLAL